MKYRRWKVAAALLSLSAITACSTPDRPAIQGNADVTEFSVRQTVRPGFLGGVIEGYYGRPWSLRDTVDMIRFIAQHHMNTYVYAPKDDPYQRSQWDHLYPSDQTVRLRTLIQAAKENGVQFVYSISPGLTITYSNARDRALLLAKINQLRTLGVHVFMLSLDDIYRGLSTSDKATYKNDMGWAQSDLANWLLAHERPKDSQFRLLLTPTQYNGTEDRPYWESLKHHLSRQVDVIWTGPRTLSEQITAVDAKKVEGYIGHRLVIWDNYPVNDFTYAIDHHPKLYMGPVIGRDPNLLSVVDGYLFNPMVQARASTIALWTGGDYLANPHGYRPSLSWRNAIHTMGGPAESAFRLFCEDSSSYYRDNQPPQKLSVDASIFWSKPQPSDLTKTAIYGDFLAMSKVDAILAERLPDKALYSEIRPWSQLLSEQGKAGILAVQMMMARRDGRTYTALESQLNALMRDIQGNANSIADDVTSAFVRQALANAQA